MSIRTESDIVRAVNSAVDLEQLVVGFLLLWRTHGNRVFDITVPTGDFCISFMQLITNSNGVRCVSVALLYADTINHATAKYHDSNSDYFNESICADNISHYEYRNETVHRNRIICIPIDLLLMSKDNMTLAIKDMVAKEKARIKEAGRQREIADLKRQLEKLEANNDKT